jgi:FHA domain
MSTPRAESAKEIKRVIELERLGDAFLRYRAHSGELELVRLGEGRFQATIGRGEQSDVSLPWDAYVSSVHAEIRQIAGEWTVSDEGLSRNGTFLNGERLSGRQRLRDGDSIRIGKTVIVYCAPTEAGSAMTTSIVTGEARVPRVTDAQRRVIVALCRPYKSARGFVAPASNQTIAEEVFLTVDAVKGHLRALFAAFGIDELPQNQKRARLADLALAWGIVSEHEL